MPPTSEPPTGADDDSLVRQTRHGPVATVTLDAPHNRNALSRQVLDELFAALQELQADPEVRLVVLTGAGSVFCSGVDMQERLHPPARAAGATLPEVLSSLVALPQPVVARVNGHVRGGGMGLVAAADLAVAPATASFAFSEVRVGVAPAVIAVPVLAHMDRRAFARYALTGDVFRAPEAAEAGLLTLAVDDIEAMDAWIAAITASVLRSSPGAVSATKGLPGLVADHSWDDALASAESLSDGLFRSPSGIEGMSAFLEKRDPSWAMGWPPG